MPRKYSYSNSSDAKKKPEVAGYAVNPEKSRGRLYKEIHHTNRSPFQRDRDRIIHATAFRRLEYKTQVFVNNEGDHYRTRLTHSLEVAQLSRSVGRGLGINEDLCEALALAHDLGHPPFGHAGEEALEYCMQDYGGFDHNAQSIRILTKLEEKYAEFPGLNLSWETLEGIAKHNGPVIGANSSGKYKTLPRALAEYNRIHNLELDRFSSLEAQITSLCDDIAYVSHDVEDGLRAGLFSVNDIADVPLSGDTFIEVMQKYPNISDSVLIHETKRRLINKMCGDLVAQTSHNLKQNKIISEQQIRENNKVIAGFSAKMQEAINLTKEFLMEQMYRHYKVNRMTSKGKRIISELFEFFMNEPECLPTSWRKKAGGKASQATAELVADFIAGMTDRFAVEEHRRIFDLSYKIIG